MLKCDVLIIGAGLCGVFCARNLARYDLSIAVLEKNDDVCTGISKANTGIIYTGYNNKPGSAKARLCVQANEDFDRLSRELSVRFRRPGSLMISCGPQAERVLRKKFEDGKAGGVKNLRLISGDEAQSLEPNLAAGITLGLLADDTGVINPWELCIAAYENAGENGVSFFFNEEVMEIERTGNGFCVCTAKETYEAACVINAAGLSSDRVREMLEKPLIRLYPTAADYILLDRSQKGFVNHIIFHEGEDGKGLTVVPALDGNIMLGPTNRKLSGDNEALSAGNVSAAGLSDIISLCEKVVPGLDLSCMIRTFGSERPNPYRVREENGIIIREEKSIKDFVLLEENGFFSLTGIKTPGLTFSNELGKLAAEKCAAFLGKDTALRSDYDPVRKAPVRVSELSLDDRNSLIKKDPAYGRVVCRCMDVTEGEIRDAVYRGARTAEQIKRRTGAFLGTCQGSRCGGKIAELIKTYS